MLDIHSIHNPAANAVHSQIYVAVDAILLFPYSPHFSVLGSSLQPFILLSQLGDLMRVVENVEQIMDCLLKLGQLFTYVTTFNLQKVRRMSK